MRFSEVLKQYAEEKRARGMTGIISAQEIKEIRKLYREGRFDNESKNPGENLNPRQKREYEKTLAEFRNFKESKGLGRGVSTKQKRMIERTILAGTLTPPVEIMSTDREKTYLMGPRATGFREDNIDSRMRNPRLSSIRTRTGRRIEDDEEFEENLERTRMPSRAVRESARLARIRALRERSERRERAVSYTESKIVSDARKKLLETRKYIYLAKRALRENDMMAAADATQNAGDAINAVNDMNNMGPAQGAVPQNIVDSVAALQPIVNDLATQCGIQPPVDMNADPNAGVPAVDGQAGDPNQGQMLENNIRSTKARLARRSRLLKSIHEGEAKDPIIASMEAATNPRQFHDIDKTDSEELVKPTTKKSATAANTWPTVKATVKESVTERMVSERINEMNDTWDFNRILREGIMG